ncbi:MAG: NADP-dependent oxidoreductase [Solirubrobacterales bacterium]
MATMKAVRMHSYGGPEVLVYEDVPRPRAGKGDVLVQVYAAGVNPVDWKVREGYAKDRLGQNLPLILGWDVSGVVEEVGPGVSRLKVGDAVFSRPDSSRDGAYAEYIAIRESLVALKPKSVDHVHAAAIPLAAMTAWQALFDVGGLARGQRVLIHAAAGGVGTYAVQLAKWKGAYVFGTASTRNQEFLHSLGADSAIDYQSVAFETVVEDVDVVFDTIGGETQARSWSVLKKGGILVSIVQPPSEKEAAAHGVRQAFHYLDPKLSELEEIGRLVDAGKVRPIVDTVLPLSEARRAHEMSQTGHTRGKIVLKIR